jgi:hypothetical protein
MNPSFIPLSQESCSLPLNLYFSLFTTLLLSVSNREVWNGLEQVSNTSELHFREIDQALYSVVQVWGGQAGRHLAEMLLKERGSSLSELHLNSQPTSHLPPVESGAVSWAWWCMSIISALGKQVQ